MEKGSFRASAVEEAALAQKAGQVSKVIESIDGYYIVKTLGIQPAKEQSFEEAQPKIEEELRRQQYRQLTDAYVAKMQSKTTLQAVDRFEQTALEAAEMKYLRRR
jgi:parvulin-like peptidyl-prolyl isomerase